MKSLYVLGGQRTSNKHKEQARMFERGLIVRVDLETGDLETCVDYVSPPEVRAEDTAILFKAGTLQGDKLYACTETEVVIYSFPGFKQVGYVSLPRFNDLHHVRPAANGNLLVADTGLDMVVEITPDGQVLREWNVLGEDPWDRFSKDVDYRRISTKPHKSHPNYVFQLGEDIWTTRFQQRDAVCLTRRGQSMKIEVQRPHDGIVQGEFVYFTTVDGHIIVINRNDRQIEEVIELNGLQKRSGVLGWCRGLMAEGDRIWVGFSRIRPTRFRGNVSWIKHGLLGLTKSGEEPTRIACYDIVKKEFVKEFNLEMSGLNAVFGIVAESERA